MSRIGVGVVADLSIYDPLRTIGFDAETIICVSRRFKHDRVQQWADITLAARERHGLAFFNKSPQAYFIDNLRQAADGGRTPPDCWWECKREREQRISSPLARKLVESCGSTRRNSDRAFLEYLKGDGRADFERVTREVLSDLCRGGMPRDEAFKRATELSHDHLKRRFIQSRVA